MASEAGIKAWLRVQGLWLYAGKPLAEGRRITHVFLDGGKACIPHERRGEFFERYAADLAAGERTCAVERTAAEGAFRMFIDVDLKSADLESADLKSAEAMDLDAVLRDIAGSLPHELAPDSVPGRVIVCKRVSGSNPTPGNRSGLHLVWTDVVVDAEQALRLLAVAVGNLRLDCPDSPVDWPRALDGSVYRNNGLRMVFAAKGPQDTSRYVPWRVLLGDRMDDVSAEAAQALSAGDCAGILRWVRDCSIHPPDLGAPRLADGAAAAKLAPVATSRAPTPVPIKTRDIDTAVTAALMGTRYEGVSFAAPVALSDEPNAYIVHLASRFCHNIQREHRSNRVYLIVTRTKVVQACFCRCAHTGCSAARIPLLGPGNPASRALFPPPKCADLRPPTEGRAMARMMDMLAKHRPAN